VESVLEVTALVLDRPARRARAPLGFEAWPWLVLALVGLAVATPLVFLVLGSFSSARLPGDFSLANLTLANYATVWLDPVTYAAVLNTVVYVVGTTLLAITVAAMLAWLVERTNVPGRTWLYAGIPMTLAMPGMLQAMAYVLLLSPRIGFLNKMIEPLGLGPINIYSLPGMILLEAIRMVPSAFLVLVPLLRSMDPSLEDAAAIAGARPDATLRKITLRLMVPGLLAVTIYQAMTAFESFEIPGILGLPAHIYVFSTRVYAIVSATAGLPNYGAANALSIIYVVIGLLATMLYARMLDRSGRYSIVTGKAYRPRAISVGSLRWPVFGLVFLFLLFSIILPFAVLLYISFLPFVQTPSAAAFRVMSLSNYTELWDGPRVANVLRNTAVMVAAASVFTAILSFIISTIVIRSRFRFRRLLDQLAFMPHAIPGIVMGVAFLWLFLEGRRIGIDLFGGVWSMAIAFTVGFMAFGTRSMNAAMLQIHKELEEAAQISGAAPWRSSLRIVYPLVLPSSVGVVIWAMLQSVRQVGYPLLLTEGGNNEVLSVFVWRLWNEGQIGTVGAVGSIMIAGLLLITSALRVIGFRRAAHSRVSD
jgi:iron(III) transport system permease protein